MWNLYPNGKPEDPWYEDAPWGGNLFPDGAHDHEPPPEPDHVQDYNEWCQDAAIIAELDFDSLPTADDITLMAPAPALV